MRVLSWKVRRFKPERVVISSFAIGKNISLDCHASLRSTCDSVSTKLYLHSPMQYVWSHKEEYLAKFSGRKKRLFSFLVPRLQKWDKQFRQFDEVFFNSKYTQALAKKIYGMEGKISYPKLKDTFYYAGVRLQPQNYFVCVGRLVTFVRECDMIIEAFNQLQLPLLMIGAGPDEQYLKSLAGDTIIFLGWLSPEDTQKVVKDAKALVNMTKESF
ncbi:MAG: glycosyltransferase [Candidatus Peribacteria bacterium]|nr:glycosyltransferase [Candidatus Peribacteria bacterium]